MCERGAWVLRCACVGMSASWSSQIRTGSYMFSPSERDSECCPECMRCVDWANTLWAGSCIFHLQTDTRTNTYHSLCTHVAVHLVPPVSFYPKAYYPSYFLCCTWPQNSSHLVCLSSIIDTRKTLVFLPGNLLFFSKLFRCTHCGGKCLLTSFICLCWWGTMGSLWKSIVLLGNWKQSCWNIWWWLKLRIRYTSHVIHYPEVSLSQANWTLYIFRQSHTYTWDPAVMTHQPDESVSSVCVPVQKGLMGTSAGDLTQEAPWTNPLHPHLCPTSPLLPATPPLLTTLRSIN